MLDMKDNDLFNFLISEATHPFVGWNFSHITTSGRMVEAPLTWSYTSKLLMPLREAQALLDMGTGGGEYLASLQPLPPLTSATEGYTPNVPIARQRLEPLGVYVYQVNDSHHLPFEDNQFDLIINRHEYYDPHEVLRILKSEGLFITQQVGGANNAELNGLLGAGEDQFAHWTLDYATRELEAAGWQIVEQREDHPITRFYDVGAIVYYLKAVPWQIPDFSVEKYFDKLEEIHKNISTEGYLDVHMHRFLIVNQKL